ncbi:ABC-2 type transport system permease protein [Rhizobium tibeticum]|nr:ABC-2 type transport system permease protein [Rhizobium tibeticum]
MDTRAARSPAAWVSPELVLVPLQLLSGGTTPRESMPKIVQTIMLAAPNTHFVFLSQAALFRGAGLSVVWPQLAALFALGAISSILR